jgi:hypothetical protein
MNGAPAARLPFTSAALRYRELFFSRAAAITLGAAAQDSSPTGNAIKSYGYLRRLLILVTGSGGSGGNLAADAPWNFFSQISVTQPNGEEMFGGPTFTGYHAFLAAQHAGRMAVDNPAIKPSFIATSPNFRFILPVTFEMDAEHGVGSLPNQDFSAPWKLQLTVNTSTVVFQTAPTTAPTFTVEIFMDCWTVPSPVNALNPNIQQEVAPPLLGTLFLRPRCSTFYSSARVTRSGTLCSCCGTPLEPASRPRSSLTRSACAGTARLFVPATISCSLWMTSTRPA